MKTTRFDTLFGPPFLQPKLVFYDTCVALPSPRKWTPSGHPSCWTARSAKWREHGSARVFVTLRGPKVRCRKLRKFDVARCSFFRGRAGATLGGPKNDTKHYYLLHLAHFGGPEGRHGHCLERSILGLFLALPEPHRSLVNYDVRSTFLLHVRHPVRDHIRCTFSWFSKKNLF